MTSAANNIFGTLRTPITGLCGFQFKGTQVLSQVHHFVLPKYPIVYPVATYLLALNNFSKVSCQHSMLFFPAQIKALVLVKNK